MPSTGLAPTTEPRLQTIDIVNGTTVTPSATQFTVGADYNLTVTVLDSDGAPVKTAAVYLMWEDTGVQFNTTTGDNTVGNGRNGEYVFWITKDDQLSIAPQNITIAAEWVSGFWGYGKVIMERNHDMIVNCTPTTSLAGNGTTYDITVSTTGGGHPSNLGSLDVAIYNETGSLVTGTDAWSYSGDYSITDEQIILSGGVYHIFAHNDTYDSQGNNATITVTNYTVTSSPSVFAWKIDKKINVTFQVAPAYNGVLTLNNITSSLNGSYPGQSTTVSITDGVGTITDFNATTLGNVTYAYAPDDGDLRAADGLTRVTTATATPSPANIYINEPANVVITVTNPSTNQPISGVWVSLDRNDTTNFTSVLAKVPSGTKTDAAGQVTFALNAQASGNITIYVENVTDPDNPFVIVAGGRSPMAVSLASPTVNEGLQFTVDIKSGNQLLTGVTVSVTFAGTTTTTTTGQVTLTAPSVSTNIGYPLTATATGYSDATTTVTVLNVPQLIIAVITSADNIRTGQSLQVAIADDSGNPVIGATVTITGTTITATSGAGGVATLTTPTVTVSTGTPYTLTAAFPSFTAGSATVTVTASERRPRL